MNIISTIKRQIRAYKKKYYTNILIKGLLLFFALILTAFLVFSSLEFIGNFNKLIRGIFFFTFISITLFSLIKWVFIPIKQLMNLDKELSDENASKQIGEFFPEIKDKLLNALQLHQLAENDALLQASIKQKTADFSHIPFVNAIDYSINKKYLKYFFPPLLLIFLFLLFIPQLFSEGAKRIINYEQTFVSNAPFDFLIQNNSLKAFKNEDFIIQLNVEGKGKRNRIPKDVFVVIGDLKRKMIVDSVGKFSFKLEKIKENIPFHFVAAGYESVSHEINVIYRPQIQSIIANLTYPPYLNKKNETLKNTGSFTIPEGTEVNWLLKTQETEKVKVLFNKEIIKTIKDNNKYSFEKTLKNTSIYEIELSNKHSKNMDNIIYSIQIIKDRFPTVKLESYKDTVLYNYILLGGALIDDHGISNCQLFYRIKAKNNKKENTYIKQNIPFSKNQTSQKLFYQLNIENFELKTGESLEYFIKVWDNDGVNGPKSSISQKMYFTIPTEEEVESQLAENNQENSDNLNKTLEKAQELQKEIKRLKNQLKSKKELSWQDKKELEKLLEKHKELEKELQKMEDNFKKGEEQLERFNKQSENVQKKVEQIKELMEEVLDDETKKLMEELKKLMEEKKKPAEINELLEKLEFNNEDVENELERTLELYKQMKFEQQLEKNIEKLNKLAKKQDDLAKESLDKETSKEELEQKQEELNKELEEAKKDLKKLKEDNKKLKHPNDMENMDSQQEMMKDAQEKQQDSKEALQKNQRKKASKSQKDAGQKIKKMAQQMAGMQQDMQMEQNQENIKDLQAILENLVTLSFDQEKVMKGFQQVRQSDPKFIKFSQEQLKLHDDSQIIKDSLLALAGRIFQLKSFVTKELGNMNENMQKSSDYVKMRKPYEASKYQQKSMTSINNLALLLNDILKQMQEQMAQQMQGNQMCQKPGDTQKPGVGKKQKQLNDMIQQLKNGQKSGRELSEELAKLAAQQEAIRRELQEMRKGGKLGKELGDQLKALEKQMEETELDLVRKNITEKTLKRQQQIQTRLLEAEKAAKEQNEDKQREANTAKQNLRETPPAYEEYLKKKEQQIELLKTISPSLNQYYKKEVNEYFNNLEN